MKFLSLISVLLALSILPGQAHAQHVIINEVMYAPIKPEPEWIELFNSSDSTVSIKGWTISNHLRTYPLLPDTIAPQDYLILTKDSVNVLRLKYHIPNAHILQTTLPSFVNTGDDLVIKDSLNHILDSIKYIPAMGGGTGKSLERIDVDASGDFANFGGCTDSLGGTPGMPNSIRRRDYDLAIESLFSKAQTSNNITIVATIVNKGRKVISEGILSVHSNSGLPLSQSIISAAIQPLERQDVEMVWQNADYGRTTVTASVFATEDELHLNDTLRGRVYLPIPKNGVVINEIMSTPISSSSQWIELYNAGTSIAHMDSTVLSIGGTDSIYTFMIDSLELWPKQYAVIDASTKFFSEFPALKGAGGMIVLGKSTLELTENGNELLLLNSDKSIIDSLQYYSNWHSPNISTHTGISLERKSPGASSTDASNWSSSLDQRGSTPLEKNSYSDSTITAQGSINIHIDPNPFSPDGDGSSDATTISIAIPGANEEVISAMLYDLRGRLRSTIAVNQRMFRSESIKFEGKDDKGITLPIGLYTLVVESANGAFPPQRTGLVIMKRHR